MDYVLTQTFKYIKETKSIVEENSIRLLHMTCNPTVQDKECKYCNVAWDYEKAMYCECEENNIYDHHKYCRLGAGYDLNEDGSYYSDGFKSEAMERLESNLESLDNLPLRVIQFKSSFEQCEKVDDSEHFQQRRTKACAKCAI